MRRFQWPAWLLDLAWWHGATKYPRRRRRAWRNDPYSHRGIELVIEIPGQGELVRADSDVLYYASLYGSASHEITCGLDCTDHGWLSLTGEMVGWPELGALVPPSPSSVIVRIRPRLLGERVGNWLAEVR